MNRKILAILAAVALLAPVTAFANSIAVNGAAALGGTNFGMEVDYTGAPSLAYVQSNEPAAETNSTISMIVDPNSLALGATGNVRIMNVFRDFGAGGVSCVLFLTRNSTDTTWRVFLMCRNDANAFTACGGGFFTGGAATVLEVILDYAGTRCAMTRTLDSPGATTFTIVDNTTFDFDDNWSIGNIRVGSVSSAEFAPNGGSTGSIYIDEYVHTRN